MLIRRSLAVFLIGSWLINAALIWAKPLRVEASAADSPPGFVDYSAPETLNFDELMELAKAADPPATLLPKLTALLSEPFVSNEAHLDGAAPELPRSDRLGTFIRLGFWNIERGRGLEGIKLALTSPEEVQRRV
jgi:hypothetical protein